MIKRFIFFSLLLFSSTIQAGIVIVNGLTHTYTLAEGTLQQGVITIQNTSEFPQDVKLFLSDYSYNAEGVFFYNDPEENPRTNARWIALNTSFLTLKGKEKTDILYEIHVPKEQNLLPGTYWSVIMVEPVETFKPSDEKPGLHINSVVRYAIQIITHVKKEKAASLLTFKNVQLNDKNDQPVLEVDLTNEGELYHQVKVNVKLYNEKGNLVGEYSGELMGLLPTTSKRFHVVLDNLAAGNYSAIVTAETDNDQSFGLQLDLELKNE